MDVAFNHGLRVEGGDSFATRGSRARFPDGLAYRCLEVGAPCVGEFMVPQRDVGCNWEN